MPITKKPEPAELLKEYLSGLPIELQLDELLKSFVDMLEYVMFIGYHDDYLIWEQNKTEYKKNKALSNKFYDHWKKNNNINPNEEN